MTTQALSGAPPQPETRATKNGAARRLLRSAYFPIWPATLVLFAASPLIATGSAGLSALRGMLPFAAVLAIVAAGQTLVIQQRGLDLTVPGVMSLSAILATKLPAGHDGRLLAGILPALAVGALAGLASGVAVARFAITPLVATLGVNALLLGTILRITGGSSTASAAPGLAHFAFGGPLGLSNLAVVAVLVVAVTAVAIRATAVGRRFIAIGTSSRAAIAAGLPVRRYVIATYVAAGLLYSLGGILVAGYLRTPGLSVGDTYLLPSIAAVVLGGTSLAGGGGSVVATAAGALFLTQLQQVVFGAGAPASVQLLIQGGAIGVGMAARTVPWRRRRPAVTAGP